jgi:hypothetical protein
MEGRCQEELAASPGSVMSDLDPLSVHTEAPLFAKQSPVPQMVQRLRGKLIGDRGYISASLTTLLFEQGLHLITRLRKNMKNHLMHLSDKLLVRKRAIIESIIDQLKNISQIEHSRHRSPTNFVIHLIAGLLAYSHQDKKPGLHLDQRLRLAA